MSQPRRRASVGGPGRGRGRCTRCQRAQMTYPMKSVMKATQAISATRAMTDSGRAHQRSSAGDCTEPARRSRIVPSRGAFHSSRSSSSCVPFVRSSSIVPGRPTRKITLIDVSGVAPLAAISSANGSDPTAAIRSSSAKVSNPFERPNRPLRRVVVSSPVVLRTSDIWLNGGPRLLSRFVASSSETKSCVRVMLRPPSGVAVGPSMTHPAATMSSVANSSAIVGTAATTSASAVATTDSVPVPSGATVMSTFTSSRHAPNAIAQRQTIRTRRTTGSV